MHIINALCMLWECLVLEMTSGSFSSIIPILSADQAKLDVEDAYRKHKMFGFFPAKLGKEEHSTLFFPLFKKPSNVGIF